MTEEQKETYYVILNMNIQYEICRMCPKSGLFKGTYKECEAWIKGATEATKELQEENKHIYERMTRIDKVLNEKNEQIEKMKCCFNCAHLEEKRDCFDCNKHNIWELKE